MTNTAKVEIEVPMARLWDVVESGFHGGINGWCRKVTPINVTRISERPDNLDDNLGDMAKEWRIHPADDDLSYTLGEAEMQKALALMAKEYPWHLNDILTKRYDAATGDAFIQLAIFGKLIYG
jgi:hypothetical protein